MIEGFVLHWLIITLVGIIFALAFNLIVGYTGQLNLGAVALFCFGAYASALLAVKAQWPIMLSIICAALLTSVVSVIIGLPTKRVKKEYFHLASLGFMFIISGIARNWIDLTDGALGIKGIPRLAATNVVFFLVLLSITLLVFIVFHLIVRSPLGRIFQGIRDDELAVQSLGYDVYKYKLLSFAISGFFMGLSGAIWGHYVTFIDPTIFNLADLILYLAVIILGGLASLRGTIVGVIVLRVIITIPQFIGVSSTLAGPIREMLFSFLLILFLVYKPRGLFGGADLT